MLFNARRNQAQIIENEQNRAFSIMQSVIAGNTILTFW